MKQTQIEYFSTKTIIICCILLIGKICVAQDKKTDSLITLSKTLEGDKLLEVLTNIGKESVFTDTAFAKTYFYKAIELAIELENIQKQIEIYNSLARMYLDHGEFDECIRISEKAKSLAEENNITNLKIKSLNLIGNANNFKGSIDEAISTYFDALKLAEKIKDPECIVESLNGLGVAFKANQDLENSSKYWEKALEYIDRSNDKRKIATIYNNMGTNYRDLKDFNKALEYFELSLKYFHQINYIRAIAIVNRNLGRVYEMKEDYKKAIDHYNESVNFSKKNNLNNDLSMYYNDIANSYYKLNNYTLAAQAAQECLVCAKSYYSSEDLFNAYNILRLIETKRGNSVKALGYYELETAYKDSLFNESKSRQIKELEAKYETEKKEQRISFLSKQNRNHKITNIIVSIALVLSVLIIILLYSRFKMKRKVLRAKRLQAEAKLEEQKAIQRQQELESKLKLEEEQRKQEELKVQAELTLLNNEKLQAELDYSHRELSSTTMYAYQKNEILNKINEIIIQLTPENQETKEKVKELKGIVKNNLDDENDWERLKLHFEKVHPDFFSSLHEKHPSLTQHELKHCAYLKIKLSNKEIAALLNVSPKSMQMARYRLKKKMDLSPDEDLLEFIDAI